MKAFLGLLLLMGYVKFPAYDSYWNTNYLTEMRGYRSVLPRDRWLGIWQFFHLADNSKALPKDHPQYDKSYKVRHFITKVVGNWQTSYYPDREVSVDESIIAFKGRTTMMQYMPQKPHKWGLKAWALCESKSGYAYNWGLYTGRKAGGVEVGLAHAVVMEMCRPILENRHHVYMDNFFSSPDLFENLATKNTGACGTLRINRRGTPNIIKAAKMKKGDPPVICRDGRFAFITWQDKKQVTLLTSVHNTQTIQKTVRAKDPANDNCRTIEKPKAIELYNRHMGGVDLADQRLWNYMSVHRTVKWWKKVFVYLLEVCFVNSAIIWQTLHQEKRFRLNKFRMAVIHGLVSATGRRTPAPNTYAVCEAPTRLTGRHFPGKNPGRTPKGKQVYPDCVVCSDRTKKRHQTEYICEECGVPMHLYPCFKRYHTLQCYKIACSKALHAE